VPTRMTLLEIEIEIEMLELMKESSSGKRRGSSFEVRGASRGVSGTINPGLKRAVNGRSCLPATPQLCLFGGRVLRLRPADVLSTTLSGL
jgi:hypothetical protein